MDRTKIPFIGLKIELLIWLPNQKVVRHLLFRNKSSILIDCTHFVKGKRIQNKGKKIMSKTLHKRFFSIKFFPWMLIATHFFYYEMFLLSFMKKYHFHGKHLLAASCYGTFVVKGRQVWETKRISYFPHNLSDLFLTREELF